MFNQKAWCKITFKLIKQVFITILSFTRPFATKYVSLNSEKCMIGSTVVDLNPDEVNYHKFMISLDFCNRSCNVFDDLSTKICVPNEAKDANVKEFKTKARIKEFKALIKHFMWLQLHFQ